MRKIEAEQVWCAMNCMKIGETCGLSWVSIQLLKGGGDRALKSLTNIFNDTLVKDKLMWEWKLSLLVQVFKGKGDPLNSNSRRGIKLLEHVFKMYEKVLDRRLREVIDIDKMQCQGKELLMLCLF